MEYQEDPKPNPPIKIHRFFVLFAFLLWVFAFRAFLLGKSVFSSDAIAYYERIKFHLDILQQGVFPLWDPTAANGAPSSFFTCRIGAFNPFLFLIVFLDKIGLPHIHSYIVYLVAYYFLGMTGFYSIARRLFRDTGTAFLAYLLLLFSSLGARLFDSYIHLIMVPAIWFFYFLLAFTEKPERHLLLGLTFTSMIIVSTYIPIYFLITFLIFIICIFALYSHHSKDILRNYFNYVKKNRVFTLFCTFVFIVSVMPHLFFYQEAGSGELVLRGRHFDSNEKNVLVVAPTTAKKWGIMEDVIFSSYFADLRKFQPAQLYVPVFFYIILFLGVITVTNKRILLLFAWLLSVFFLCSPNASSLYQFLYDHAFFKYIRNFHFFLWLMLPVLILFACEQFRNLLFFYPAARLGRYATLAFLWAVHLGVVFFLIYTKEKTIVATYITIVLSCTFFSLYFFKRLKPGSFVFMAFIFAMITVEPLEVYYHFARNYQGQPYPYQYDLKTTTLSSSRGYRPKGIANKELNELLRHRFIIYDRVASIDGNGRDSAGLPLREKDPAYIPAGRFQYYYGTIWQDILAVGSDQRTERMIFANPDVAFIPPGSPSGIPHGPGQHGPSVRAAMLNPEQFRPLGYDVNSVWVKTNFPTPKFFVYNDSYHSGWQAFVNGRKGDILRANIAFKGVWLPAGENVVYMRYGSAGQQFFYFCLVGVFNGVFLYLLWLSFRFCRPRPQN